MQWKYSFVLGVLLLFYSVHAKPLDIVAGKSGEQQVKDALDRAEKESEQAAKETGKKQSDKEKEETEQFLSSDGNDKSTRSSTDLKETLDKKVAELAKFHEKPKINKDEAHVITPDVKEKETAGVIIGDKDISAELTSAETKEKENAALEEESDKKMVEMAKKLNNLVLKFQKKMGRLDHRPKNAEDLLPEKDGDGETTVKSIRGKPATHAPIDLAALMSAIRGNKAQPHHVIMPKNRPKPAIHPVSDLSNGLRNALGLLHTKTPVKSADDSAGKMSYKEDTKLEDRLAMEAEEEKKFSNGDSYDDGEDAASKSSTTTATSSLSPKEQASQEMQNYNALISSESNRELTQIQDEITKATQSSMGQVSVVGQKEQVNTESPNLPNIPGLGDSSLSGLGGAGGLSGFGGSGGLSGLGGAGSFGGDGVGGNEGLSGLGNMGGSSSSTDQFQGLQNAATEGLDPATSAAANSQISNQAPSSMSDSMSDLNSLSGQTMSSSNPMNMGSQSPIEIGSSSQTPVEMGTLGGTGNPFQNSQSGQQLENMSAEQMQTSFMSQGGGQQELGQTGGYQQQRMSFKKSKITDEKSKRQATHKRHQVTHQKHHSMKRSMKKSPAKDNRKHKSTNGFQLTNQ